MSAFRSIAIAIARRTCLSWKKTTSGFRLKISSVYW